ncbi:SusC/RagA family TonB-linked outer membrane protein [Pedobacter sp. PLR]|uniref:SusC/RagA family TonB-linked outer membrane protein n=1 Tax=Pedobacter sp. PLR TaxID=2994465 RepID=UPI002247CA82|nr:SusC/RagA family TonB-linked outer membrane protein [Pedobacter sp. PLR]MCX2452741.1 SusC/RagA family TonB-linked outer membrane protein [Pedobacter sp. PLR]
MQGTVIDKQDKVTIPGVTIMAGTPLVPVGITNGNGEFSVSVNEGSTLVFKYIGYLNATHKFDGKLKFNVIMSMSVNSLKETVVVGYQKKTKEVSTGSSVIITGKEIQDVPVGNIMELIQGKVPGVNIQNNNGSPGMRGSINVRGLSNTNVTGSGSQAFLTPTSPLFVIDGVPVDDNSGYSYGFDQAGPGISPLSMIPQEDIERIEVLKDAQATSLYGSRGAYGVFLITTKRGNSKVPVIQYTSNYFVNTPPRLRDVIGGREERMSRINQIMANDTSFYHGLNLVNITPFLSDSLNAYYNNSTDWQSKFYRQTFNQTHNVNISGGDQTFNYKVNTGYYDEKGIVENTGFTRYSMNMNMQYEPSNKFKLFASVNNSLANNSKGSGSGLLQNGIAKGGSASSLLPAPSLFSSTNSLLSALETNDENKTVSVTANVELQYEFFEGLRASSTFNYAYVTGTTDTFLPGYLNNGFNEVTAYNDRKNTAYNRNLLSYNKSINEKHNFSAYVFNEINMTDFRADMIKQKRTPSDQVQGPLGADYFNSLGGTLNNITDFRSVAFAGSFSYNYDTKYVLDLSYRIDGSSTNGPDAGYSKNPSIGLRWNFNKEAWLVKKDWLEYASLRLTAGRNIVPTGTIFDVYGRYIANGSYNQNPTVGLDLKLVPNTGLTPTETTQYNAGLDLGFLKGKIGLVFDTYYKQVDNQLREKNLANHNAFAKVNTNETSLVNYGYELAVNFRPLSENSKLSWTIGINGAINKDVLTALPNGARELVDPGGDTDQQIFRRLGMNSLSNYLLNNTGVYANNSNVPVDPLTGLRYRTGGNAADQTYFRAGDPIWTDVNGDYVLDNNDYVVVGNGQPRMTGGFTSYLAYKNFSLNMNFSFTFDRDIMNNALAADFQRYADPAYTGKGDFNGLVPLDRYDVWTQPGDMAVYPFPLDFTRYARYRPFRFDQTLFMEDGSYLKFNNATFAYNIDRKLTKRWGMTSVRLYVSANNIHTWSNYSGPDPELVSAMGRDNSGGYPNRRSYNFGINVQF